MDNDIRVQYDALCYATFVNIRTLTSKAERIAFRNFKYGNKEHQFILAVTMACWNILGEKQVAIDDNMFARATLSKKYKSLGGVKKTNKDELSIDVDEILEYMRGAACEVCGDQFTFGDIYDAYYSGKED